MPGSRPLPGWVAAAVTFLASGAVLVLEIAGLRLIAPYVGITLQTNTAVIGFALAAIAVGAWAGGAVADRRDPRGLLAPLLVAGGALVVAVVPVVRFAGALLAGAAAGDVLLLAAVAVVLPAALLSAVPPMVVALQLGTLRETGTVVGRLSGIGTLGGDRGHLRHRLRPGRGPAHQRDPGRHRPGGGRHRDRAVACCCGAAPGAAGRGCPARCWWPRWPAPGWRWWPRSPCQVETTYHCARVVADPYRDGGRTLVLDTLRHSYVDLADPTHLEFGYVRAIASVTDTLGRPGEALSALHIGGGGLTLPRYLAAGPARHHQPGAGGRRRRARRRPGRAGPGDLGRQLQVDVGDARTGLAAGGRPAAATWSSATPSAGSPCRGS